MNKNSIIKNKITQLEKVFQVPARLRIMSVLMANKKADFSELIEMLELTRGNLSMHMKMLEGCKYITIKKQFVNRKPRTTYHITSLGKKDFIMYIKMLEGIIASSKVT